MSKDAKVLFQIVEPLAFVLAVLAFAAAGGTYLWRNHHLDIIKRESVERAGTQSAA